MKILFINPCVRPDTPKKIINIGLAYVMSAVHNNGFTFDLLDIDAHRYTDNYIEEFFLRNKYDVVLVGTLVSMYSTMKRLVKLIRESNHKTIIVAGNTLATSISKHLLANTEYDVAVLSEGELTTVNLLEAIRDKKSFDSVNGIAFMNKGKYYETPPQKLIPDLDKIEIPNYGLFDLDIYLDASRLHVAAPQKLPIPLEEVVAFPVNTARGCPFRCNFCYHAFQEKQYRVRSPRNVVDEIKLLKKKYNVNFINFWDELTWASAQHAEEFADALIEEDLNVYWIASCRSELFVRREGGERIVNKLKKSGCHGLAFSLESGSPEILESMNKKNTVDEYIEQCILCNEAEIDIFTSLIIGYPQESNETIDESFDVMKKAKTYPSVGFLQLMPGTPMYEYGKKEKAITDEEEYLLLMGDRQDLRINLTEYDDNYLMDYCVDKLKELNTELKMGLKQDNLIKTGTWKGSSETKRSDTENFMEDFGISGDILRECNFTERQ